MFNFFKKKPKMPKVSDKIWVSNSALETGLITEIKSLLKQHKLVLIGYYFNNTLKTLEKLLSKEGMAVTTLDRFSSEHQVIFVPAQEIEYSNRIQNTLKELLLRTGQTILFAEHYPQYGKEETILSQIATMSDSEIKAIFFTSLASPLMKIFGSERILALVEQLGVQEDEALEHTMISSAINRAQKKVEEQVTTDGRVDSMEEWFECYMK